MMSRKGFVGGPFQLLINIVVFGMALMIAAYLFNMIDCWKCEELLKMEATELREAIASVGKGDVNSRKNILVEVKGTCAEGIYINHLTGPPGLCRSFCPSHPNDCWIIIADSRCSGDSVMWECIDISGDMTITSFLPPFSSPDPFYDTAYTFDVEMLVKIEKTGTTDIDIGIP